MPNETTRIPALLVRAVRAGVPAPGLVSPARLQGETMAPYLILGYAVVALAVVAAILCGWPF